MEFIGVAAQRGNVFDPFMSNLYQAITSECKQAIVAVCQCHAASTVVFDGTRNYGLGMALEELKRMFHRFYSSPQFEGG